MTNNIFSRTAAINFFLSISFMIETIVIPWTGEVPLSFVKKDIILQSLRSSLFRQIKYYLNQFIKSTFHGWKRIVVLEWGASDWNAKFTFLLEAASARKGYALREIVLTARKHYIEFRPVKEIFHKEFQKKLVHRVKRPSKQNLPYKERINDMGFDWILFAWLAKRFDRKDAE